jgi:hypothetical protein
MIYRRNSTIGIKSKPCISCGKVGPIFSRKRCADCARIEDTQARMDQENEKLIEEEDLSGLIEDADAIFSRYIRLKYANANGIVKCFTCDTKKHWTLMQNGHFVKRGHLRFRLDERNCRPQCTTCNELNGGMIAVFRENLDKESPGVSEYLYDEMKLVYKPTREEIRQVIAEYTPKVKLLMDALKK